MIDTNETLPTDLTEYDACPECDAYALRIMTDRRGDSLIICDHCESHSEFF